MSQWPIYTFMKVMTQRTGKVPTYDDVSAHFPSASIQNKCEGRYDFLSTFDSSYLEAHEIHGLEDLIKKVRIGDAFYSVPLGITTAYDKLFADQLKPGTNASIIAYKSTN